MRIFAYGLLLEDRATVRSDLQEYLVREFPGCEAEVLPNGEDEVYDTLLLLCSSSEDASIELLETCFDVYDDITRYELLRHRPLGPGQSVREGYVDMRKIVSRMRFDENLDEELGEAGGSDEELDEY